MTDQGEGIKIGDVRIEAMAGKERARSSRYIFELIFNTEK